MTKTIIPRPAAPSRAPALAPSTREEWIMLARLVVTRVLAWIMTERVILISASVALEAIIWIIIALTCPVH